MTRTALPEPLAVTAAVQPGVPGLRTMRSPFFRTLVALVLLAIGVLLVGMLLVGQATAEDGQFAIDFGAYYLAAERLAGGEAIYGPEMLGGPVAAQGVDQYLYPPLFAQLLVPLTALARGDAALVWFVVQAIAMALAVWVGTGIGGARRSVERAAWCGVAAVFFLPVFDTLWKGNISGVLALSSVVVALGGALAGAGAAIGALVKAVPGTLVPAALVMDRSARVVALGMLGTAFVISYGLAPSAWLDYITVIRNMLAGAADYATNLAPATVVARTGAPEVVADLVRVGAVVLAIASLVGSIWLARSRSGIPAAALLGVVTMLLLPASLWYHYLALLLPFAAIAWPRSSRPQRVALFVAALSITLGLAWLPVALLGAITMTVLTLYALWPSASERARTQVGPDPRGRLSGA